MKTWLIAALSLAMVATTLPDDAQAKRLGSGKAAGMQRNMPAKTAPDAPPAKPAQAPQAAPATPGAAAAAPAAAAPKRNWMGPLAGIAAGLGIAALLSHMGLGGALGDFMMTALMVGAGLMLAMFLWRRFGPQAGRMAGPALAGAGAGAGPGARAAQVAWPAQQPAAPEAAPLQRQGLDAAPVAAPAALTMDSPATGATADVTRAFVPASFDSDGFTRTAKMIFIRLQTANDTADLDDLRRFTTPELFSSIRLDIQERGATPQHTDVVKVDAEVLDVADEADRQVVSVRFHGQVVEEKGGSPTDFNEVWHLVKPHDDSRSWAIAGIEQLN